MLQDLCLRRIWMIAVVFLRFRILAFKDVGLLWFIGSGSVSLDLDWIAFVADTKM
jgi:hypothetical protein